MQQLNGEIDLTNASQVANLADGLDDSTVIVLDMGGVSFLDAAGLTALLPLAARLTSTGRNLVLTGTDHDPVRKPIAIGGLTSILDRDEIITTSLEKSSRRFCHNGLSRTSAGIQQTTVEIFDRATALQSRTERTHPFHIRPRSKAIEQNSRGTMLPWQKRTP